MTADLTRASVLAFRAAGHGLCRRRPRSQLVEAAGAIGLRRTKHTALSLAARSRRWAPATWTAPSRRAPSSSAASFAATAPRRRRPSEWMAISADDARRSLDALDTVPVTVDGKRAGVLHREDGERAAGADCRGVRILPPYDAWLLDRDRAALVPDAAAREVLWRPAGNPGVVLVDGAPAAAWRTRAGQLHLDPLGPAFDPTAVQEEARNVGLG